MKNSLNNYGKIQYYKNTNNSLTFINSSDLLGLLGKIQLYDLY